MNFRISLVLEEGFQEEYGKRFIPIRRVDHHIDSIHEKIEPAEEAFCTIKEELKDRL